MIFGRLIHKSSQSSGKVFHEQHASHVLICLKLLSSLLFSLHYIGHGISSPTPSLFFSLRLQVHEFHYLSADKEKM